MSNGSSMLPLDAREAVSCVAGNKTTQISDSRKEKLEKLESKVPHLLPELHEIKNLSPEHCDNQARLHVPLLKELSKLRDSGGSTWRDQFINGFPMIGELAEPGVWPLSSQKVPGRISREKLFESPASRLEPGRGATDVNTSKLRRKA